MPTPSSSTSIWTSSATLRARTSTRPARSLGIASTAFEDQVEQRLGQLLLVPHDPLQPFRPRLLDREVQRHLGRLRSVLGQRHGALADLGNVDGRRLLLSRREVQDALHDGADPVDAVLNELEVLLAALR